MNTPFSFRRLGRWHLPAGALLLAACLTDESTVRGELGKGLFQYACDSSTRSCVSGAATVFPERIAVGTRFDLSFETNAGTADTGSLQPASEQLLEIRDSSWRAVQEGTVGILDVLPDGSLYDYTFVNIEPADGVQLYLQRAGSSTDAEERSDLSGWDAVAARIELASGSRTNLVVEARASDGSALAGEALLDFDCEDPFVVELIRPTRRPARFALGALAAGSTVCRLQALGYTQRFEVTVSGETDPPDAGPGDETDAGADAGTTDGGDK